MAAMECEPHPVHDQPVCERGEWLHQGEGTEGDHQVAHVWEPTDGRVAGDRESRGQTAAKVANASTRGALTTPTSSATAVSHGGRTTAATAIGSSSPEPSSASRTNSVA